MTDWIECTKELPSLDTPVWLYQEQDDPTIFMGCRVEDGSEWFWARITDPPHFSRRGGRWYFDSEIDDEYNPTSWMPLPDPPETKKGKP